MRYLIIKFIFIFVISVSLSFYSINKVSANEILREDFITSYLDTNYWTLLNETNVDILRGNFLSILSVDRFRSIFVQNTTPFNMANGISFEIKFRFNEYWYGGGLALNDNDLPLRVLNGDPGLNDWTILVWPVSNSSFTVFSAFCLENEICNNTYQPLFTINESISKNWHILKVLYRNDKYFIQLDGSPERITISTHRSPKHVWFGNPMKHGDANTTTLDIDYLYINDLISIPSFPYFSQLDQIWASTEYDSAKNWAGLEKSGIDRWGCALTSTAMIMKNYGVKALDGNEINPEKLNAWLKTQRDGYIGPGLLNWLAITRYARESYTLYPAGSTKLEYERSYLPTTPVLPAILGVPGHFVVAHDENLTNWIINDPANNTKTELPKISTITSVNRFIPSLTDLSYILLVSKPGVTTTLHNPSNSIVPITWTTEYLSDDLDGSLSPPILSALLSKPDDGKYILKVNNANTTQTDFDIYLYDESGDVNKVSVSPASGQTEYEINYDSVHATNSSVEMTDTAPPRYLSTTSFSGWYRSPQKAIFEYSDPNMPTDFVPPFCMIANEGLGLTCRIIPDVCDKSNNCNNDPQISNPVDIDYSLPISKFDLPTITNSWDGRINGAAEDHPSGISKVELIIIAPTGDENIVDAYGTTDWSYIISPLDDGVYTVRSRATDIAGNVETILTQRQLLLDTKAPKTPTIRSGFGWFNRIFIDWRKVDSSHKYAVYIGSKKDNLIKIDETSKTEWISNNLKQGQYYVGIKAIDEAGNESQLSKIIKIEVHKKWDWRRL